MPPHQILDATSETAQELSAVVRAGCFASEDDAIRDVIALQERVGLRSITDGERLSRVVTKNAPTVAMTSAAKTSGARFLFTRRCDQRRSL